MSVFAYHVPECCLHVFTDASAALACAVACSDVDDWLFFDDRGSPLKLDRLQDYGTFLRPWASCASCSLEQVLYQVRQVSGERPLDSVEAIRAHLQTLV